MSLKKLIWSRSSGNLKTFLKDAFTNTTLQNVTFVLDDDTTVKAHKIILCAASSLMKDILVSVNDGEIFIHIDGYQNKIVKCLLELIYTGACSTGNEEASEVKTLANELQIDNIEEIKDQVDGASSTKHEKENEDESIPIIEDKVKNEEYKELPPTTDKTDKPEKEKIPSFDSLCCPECQNSFKSKATLKNHYKSVHLQIKWNCFKCDKVYPLESSLRAHTKSIHETVVVKCDECSYQGTRADNLKLHVKNVHQKSIAFCNHCDFVGKHWKVRQHVKEKHPRKTDIFKCSECDFSSLSEAKLKHHVQFKHEGVVFPCDQCNYKAPRQSFLDRHSRNKHEGFVEADTQETL